MYPGIGSCKGNVLTSPSPLVESERSIDHIGPETSPIRNSTAVRNIGQ